MRLEYLLGSALGIAVLALPARALDDAYEDNDTCADAAFLTVPANGQFHEFAFVSSGPASAGGADDDWFEFDLPAGHGLRAFVIGQVPGDPGVDVYLTTGAHCGTVLHATQVGGGTFGTENPTGATLRLQLHFQPVNPSFVQEDLRLYLWMAPLSCPGVVRDTFEPNPSPAQASPIPSGLYRGLTLNGRHDRDVYSVDVPIGGTLQIGFGSQQAFGPVATCRVLDATGTQSVGTVPSGGGLRSFTNATATDTLLIDVAIENVDAVFHPCERYDLFLDATASPCAGVADDGFETIGNDTRSEAIPLGRGRYPGLSLLQDDEDWFTVTVPPGFGLILEATPETSRDAIRMESHEAGNPVVYERRHSSLQPLVLRYGNPSEATPRTLDVRFERPTGPTSVGCASYDLDISFVRELDTTPLCPGTPDLGFGPKTIDLFGSLLGNGDLWVTAGGVVPHQQNWTRVYVGLPESPLPTGPLQICVADPRHQWAQFRWSPYPRRDALVDDGVLAPIVGTTLALQYFDGENGFFVHSETVTFLVQ